MRNTAEPPGGFLNTPLGERPTRYQAPRWQASGMRECRWVALEAIDSFAWK